MAIFKGFPYYLCLIILFIYGCETKSPSFDLTGLDLQEGDIVFRKGNSLASQLVLKVDEESFYSHIGIVVSDNGAWKVVHAVPDEPDYKGDQDRVKMDDLNVFFSSERASAGAIMRFESDSIESKKIEERVKRIFQRNTLFDHYYNLDDTTKMYCTELIYFVFKEVSDIDITEGRRTIVSVPALKGSYILPSDIRKNPNLKMISSF